MCPLFASERSVPGFSYFTYSFFLLSEKKDLVELVLQQSDGIPQEAVRRPSSGPTVPQSRSWQDDSIRVSDQVGMRISISAEQGCGSVSASGSALI
jgi:hypothetical protein